MSLLASQIEIGLQAALKKATTKFIAELHKKMEQESMNNTGKLKNSIKDEINTVGNVVQALVMMKKYGFYHDRGVRAANIPFGGRTGRGGKSKFIEGLRSYFLSKGFGPKKALGIAFATAHKQKLRGAPLRYNGKGSAFLTETIIKMEPEIKKLLKREATDVLRIVIVNQIRQTVKEFNKAA